MTKVEAPQNIVIDWELLDLIYHYTNLPMVIKDEKYVFFSSEEIKRYYSYLVNPYEILTEVEDFLQLYDSTDFDETFGEHTLYSFLKYQDGVEYDEEEDMWYLDIDFFNAIKQKYKHDKNKYISSRHTPFIIHFPHSHSDVIVDIPSP